MSTIDKKEEHDKKKECLKTNVNLVVISTSKNKIKDKVVRRIKKVKAIHNGDNGNQNQQW